jgi:hypothetical protein
MMTLVAATQHILALDIADNEAKRDLEGKAYALPFWVAKGAPNATRLLSIHHATEYNLQHSVMLVCHVLPSDFAQASCWWGASKKGA